MNVVDKASEIKRKILAFIEKNGPSLPVAIAREVQIDSLFSSAFLSELLEEGIIRISKMKVGGSPLYYLPQQHDMLENFSRYLGAKEREALSLVKEKQVLKDMEQEPAIRIALRGIKDFAIPFMLDETKEIYWHHFSLAEDEARKKIHERRSSQVVQSPRLQAPESQLMQHIQTPESQLIHPSQIPPAPIIPQKIKNPKKLDIFEKPAVIEKPKPNKFIDEVKAFLANRHLELSEIDKSDKKEIVGKIKANNREIMLIAIDKKRVDDSDIIKAYKKAQAQNIPYIILSRGEPSKKLKEAIEAYKSLEKLEKLE